MSVDLNPAKGSRWTQVGLLAGMGLLLAVSGAAAAPFLPTLGDSTFTPGKSSNKYFPLLNGLKQVIAGSKTEDGELQTERSVRTTASGGPTILGVQTFTVLDRAYQNDNLVESTLDHYAEDDAGNVWYFGEDVTNYVRDEAGQLLSTNGDGSWQAGINGALPGFIMPNNADLLRGFNFYEEFAPADLAVDQGTIIGTLDNLTVPFGTLSDILQVYDLTELEPDNREFKYYAAGIGFIRADEGLSLGLADPDITLELVSSVVTPLPPAAVLLASGLAVLGARRRVGRGKLMPTAA